MLKKKFGIVTLVCLLCLCVAVLFTACGGTQGEKGDKGESGTDGKDGVSIVSVEKTDSKGLTDTYTITFSDGSKTTFTVTNGKDGVDGSDGEDGTDGETPYIGENGNWWIGSTDTKIPAKGQDGTDGNDGSDGQDGITPHIGENGNWFIGNKDTGIPAKGQNGSDGKDGISITKVDINENGELVISFTDGDPVNLGKVVGADGADGQDGADGENGISIKGATVDENGNLILTFSDDTTITAGKVKGENGVDGKDGVSVSGVEINGSGELVISFSDGKTNNLGKIIGANGKDGVGIANIELDEEYKLTIYLTEGEPIKLGCIRGEKGEAGQDGSDGQDGKDGKSAYELYKDKFGYGGSEEQWLIDLVNGNLATVQTHTITFSDIYGGSPIPSAQEVKHGEKLIRPKDPTREGYIFDGWYYKGEKWSFIGYIVTENMTLSARWIKEEEEESCAIVSADGFEFGWEEVNAQQVQTITKKLPNNVTAYDLASQITVSKGCTWRLYKNYELTNSYSGKTMSDLKEGNNEAWLIVSTLYEETRYKVNLHRRFIFEYEFQNGGTVLESGTIEEDSSIETAPETIPTKTGYTFSHWAVNGEQVDFPYAVTFRPVFDAVFTPNENTLYFDKNDEKATGEMPSIQMKTDETQNLPALGFEKAGYHFIGWAASADGEVEFSDKDSYKMKTEAEYTLYAVWKANTNTLHFDKNADGVTGEMPSIQMNTDEVQNLPAVDFEKKGYTFKGWATSANGEVEFENEDSYLMETEAEYTLYAVWEVNVYTITYNTDSDTWEQGSNPSTFTIEDLPVNLTFEPVIKNDYAFFGWYTEEDFSGESFVEFTLIDIGDITFYSKLLAGTEGLQYVEENSGYTVSQYSGSETEIVIPDFHADKPVLSIQGQNYSNPVFVNGINSITFGINTQLTSIGDYAFFGCDGLTRVEIPSGVTSIGDYAFYGCDGLTSIEIPSSVTSIGENAFYYCSSLTSVVFGENSQLTSIDENAFYYCSSLTSVVFGENSQLTSIGWGAFLGCSRLTSIEIPSSVTSIEANAFEGCSGLTSIEIPSGVTSISSGVFSACSRLTSIEIPSGVTSIGLSAFYGCYNLTSVVFGENSQLTSISGYAFRDCRGLTSIEIPNSVNSIVSEAFKGCWNLDIVYYGGASQSDWDAIGIDKSFNGNDTLINATRYYYSINEPPLNEDGTAYDGNYWHYVDGVPTVWVKEQ